MNDLLEKLVVAELVKKFASVRFEVLTAVVMRATIFWDITHVVR
jgi:hypothetical protein